MLPRGGGTGFPTVGRNEEVRVAKTAGPSQNEFLFYLNSTVGQFFSDSLAIG